MHGLLDGLLVGGLLLASVIYALLSLGPRTLKRRLAVHAAAWVRSVPAVPGLRALSRRLETAAAGKSGGACGGCEDCGEKEVRIPVATIRKR
jgi:hypothetical protein